MGITLKELIEPLSEKSRPDSLKATCDAFDRLRDGIRMYVERKINGRSFLIAGHRGSGKTFLVYRAIESLIWLPQSVNGTWKKAAKRPLLVRLHGPDLLKPFRSAEDKNETPNALNEALKQMIYALHQSACDEFANCYLELEPPKSKNKPPDSTGERAAQLLLELDRNPPPERLRLFWEEAGALEKGVLSDENRSGQGLIELSALSTLLHATSELGERPDPPHSSPESTGGSDSLGIVERLLVKGHRFIWPVASTVFGIAITSILAKQGLPEVAALAAGLLTTVLFILLFNFASDGSKASSLLHDKTLSTLNRVLPILIERLRDAGLSPIFVVDELDKVEDLAQRADGLLRHLKGLVADRAFFCFVSDRNYFDHVTNRRRQAAYPLESTYYSERFFAVYSPSELDAFLKELIHPDSAKEEWDAQLIRLLVKYRAQMHLGEILRQSSKEIGPSRKIIIQSGQPLESVKGYRYAWFLQIAIEHLLSTPEVIERLRQDPEFLPSFYDALYYIPREWEKREVYLDVSVEAFSSYLLRRLSGGDGRSTGSRSLDLDVEFLHQQMKKIARILESPGSLRDDIAHSPGGAASTLLNLYDTIFSGVPVRAAVKEELADVKFRWLTDEYGRDITEDTPAMVEDAILLLEFDKLLRDLDPKLNLEEFSKQFKPVLDPAWQNIGTAIERALAYQKNSQVRACRQDLQAKGDQIRLALLLATARAKSTGSTVWYALTLIAGEIGRALDASAYLNREFEDVELPPTLDLLYQRAMAQPDGTEVAQWLPAVRILCKKLQAADVSGGSLASGL